MNTTSEDLKRTESEIRSHLEAVRRKPDKNAHELVELLESVPKLSQKFNISCEPNRIKVSEEYKLDQIRYRKFCRAYMIYIFNHFIVEADDVEIMLVAFNYHPDFRHEPRPNHRRALYARQVYEPKHPEKHWGKSVDDKSRGLYNEEARIIGELSKVLVARTADHKGKLDILESVLMTLEPPKTEKGAADEVQLAVLIEDIKPDTSEENASMDGVEKNPQLHRSDTDALPNEPDAALPPKDNPATTEVGKTSRSKEKTQADAPGPPSNPQRTHIWQFSIDSIISFNKKAQTTVNLTWVKNPIFLIFLMVVVIMAATMVWVSFFRLQTSPENKAPPEVSAESETPPVEGTSFSVEEILVSEEDITLVPGETRPLKYFVLPEEAGYASLSLVSSDPDIVTVSRTGVLEACKDPETHGRPYQKVNVTIQAENGVSKVKTVIVNFAGIDQPKINEEVKAGFYVWQQIRIAGTKEWRDAVDAKVGDKVEIWIQYRNIGSEWQENVMIRDILPQSLRYIADTTKLWNDHLNGAVNNEDTITTTVIDIGGYGPNANAHVRFQAEVVEDGLVSGKNALYNWSQVYVGNTALQDSTIVHVNKSE